MFRCILHFSSTDTYDQVDNTMAWWLRTSIEVEVEVEVNLRPTVSRPVYLGVRLPSGAHDQSFIFHLTIAGFLMWGTLSDKRMGL
jgi:hypothetical protein